MKKKIVSQPISKYVYGIAKYSGRHLQTDVLSIDGRLANAMQDLAATS